MIFCPIIYYKLQISSFGIIRFHQSILTVRKWPRFHSYETAGNCSNRRPRFEVPPVKRLTVTRGYGLGYPKRRPRGLFPRVTLRRVTQEPVSPSSPLVSFLLSRCGGESFALHCARCVAQNTWVSFSLSMDPSFFFFFSFTDYCEIFFFAESGKKSYTEMEFIKNFSSLMMS
jgi:hypothetical protein